MKEIKISTIIKNEIAFRELHKYDYPGATVYKKILSAQATPKAKFVKILVNDEEFTELYKEADYWNGPFEEFMMPRGEWLSWKALIKQMKGIA